MIADIAPRSVSFRRLALPPEHDLATRTLTTVTDDQGIEVLVAGDAARSELLLRLR